jgi:hypothetical protein
MGDALNRANPDLPLYSEEGLLTAAVLEHPKVYAEIRWVDADIFEWQNVRTVYVAIEWVLEHHPDVDHEELVARVKNVLIEYGKGEALGLLVKMIGANTAVGVEAPRYARQLWEKVQAANLRSASMKMSQITASDSLDLDEKMQMIEQTWMEALADTHGDPGWKPIEGLESLDEFMAAKDETHDWVIPGLLEREERLMVIATEKAGKSVLTRQCCLLLPSGRHPLRPGEEIPVMTTLMIDLENPRPLASRDFRRQVTSMEGLWQEGNERAFIWHKPGGIHLGDRADRIMLRNVVDRVEPDFLAISPIYKAYDGLEDSWEQQAFGVQKPLDMIREEYHCAIWMEHHAPWGEKGKREIRAIGSSRWARWLDYTVNLIGEGEPPYNYLQWRSVRRDQRKMDPKGLRRGDLGEPSWVPVWEDDKEGWGYDLARHGAEL